MIDLDMIGYTPSTDCVLDPGSIMTNHDFLAGGRRLRAILRERRIACGLSEEAVAKRLKWPLTHLPQIETGQVPITDEELSAVLALYGITEPAQLEVLRESAKRTRQAAWWTEYQGRIPDHYLELIAAEADASRIMHFQPMFIPGLLQTRAYASAITAATTLDHSPPEYTRDRIEVRMRRQEKIFNGEHRPDIVAMMDGFVLYRLIGSATVMREQLDRLIGTITKQHATVVIMRPSIDPDQQTNRRQAVDLHPGLLGAFIVIQYDDPALGDVLCAGGALGNTLVRDAPDLAAKYRDLTEDLARTGFQSDDALHIIRRVQRWYD